MLSVRDIDRFRNQMDSFTVKSSRNGDNEPYFSILKFKLPPQLEEVYERLNVEREKTSYSSTFGVFDLVITEIRYSNIHLRRKDGIAHKLRMTKSNNQILIEDEKLKIYVCSDTVEEAMNMYYEMVIFDWEDLVKSVDIKLSKGALKMRKNLIEIYEESCL